MAELGVAPGDAVVIVLSSAEPAPPWCSVHCFSAPGPCWWRPRRLLGANSDLPRVLSATVRRTEARLVVAPASMAATATNWSASALDALALLRGGGARRPRCRRCRPSPPDPSEVVAYQRPRAPPVSPRSASGSTGPSPLPSTGWWLPWSSAKRTSSSTGPRSITTWVWSTTSSPAWRRGSHWC